MIEIAIAAFIGSAIGAFIVVWVIMSAETRRIRREREAGPPP